MFDTIFGLPVHILVIHAVVVLVPLCAVAVIVMAIWRVWRERLTIPVLILITIAALSAIVARLSGQTLLNKLGLTGDAIERHVHFGDWAPYIVGLFWAVTVAWLLLARNRERPDQPDDALVRTFAVLSVLAALFATTWIVLTGDAGSRVLWGSLV